MSTEDTKTLFRRWIAEIWNQRDLAAALAAIDDLIAADFVSRSAPPGLSPGPAGVKEWRTMFFGIFPDLHFTEEDMIAEGERAAGRFRVRGTHTGEFFGIPPTGKQFSIAVTDIIRVAGGRLAEHWSNADDLGMLQQLGVISPPGQGTP